jgi:hypothetical protein
MPRVVVLASLMLIGGASIQAGARAGDAEATAEWEQLQPMPGIVDIVGPRRDGRFVVAAGGRLSLLRPGRSPRAYADGPGGYGTLTGEPYIALAPGGRVPGAGCSFRRDDVYALELAGQPGVIRINRRGRAHRFADLPPGAFLSGIAFDTVGEFGHRLLLTGVFGDTANLYGIDCDGRVTTFVEGGPMVEGGIEIAPRRFGSLGGDLVAADEFGGGIFAFGADGSTRVIAQSGLPTGLDTGVESVGFVPRGFGRGDAAYLADRGVPGNPFPGTDSLLVLRAKALKDAGVRPGTLLVATEGGAETIQVPCSATCSVRQVASGPDVAHAEGHLEFGPAP